MGNTVVWKPSPTQQLAAHHTMRLLEAAGLPPGVINMVTGDGAAVSEVALADPDFAGPALHRLDEDVQVPVAARWPRTSTPYRSYPRIVGETGGKDFVVAHRVRRPRRGGHRRWCAARSSTRARSAPPPRAPTSPARCGSPGCANSWSTPPGRCRYGDVTDFGHFGGAVIDHRAFAKHKGVLEMAANAATLEVLAGGGCDDSVGYFVEPTVLLGTDPMNEVFTTEWFGPILAVHVFDDSEYGKVLELVDGSTPYALTGAVFATERAAIEEAHRALRFAAGNFYVNDKPTGAVVSQQPFGGSRGSGTNDKAGSIYNLQRWVSPRSVKETFVPPTAHTYPHMG